MKRATTILVIFLITCFTSLEAQLLGIATNGPTEVCEPGIVQVYVYTGPSGNWTYVWHKYEGGCMSVSNSPPIVIGTGTSIMLSVHAESGLYVCLASEAGTGNIIQSNFIAVRILPPLFSGINLPAPFSYGNSTCVGSVTLCIPNTIENDPFFNPPPSVSWYKDYAIIPNATSITYEATSSGVYNYSINGGCFVLSDGLNVTIGPSQVSQIAASGPTSFCQGGNVLLTANTGSGLSYQWRRNYSNIVGANSSNYTATLSGIYDCFVGSSFCQPVLSNSISVNVVSPPVVSFSPFATSYTVSSPPVTLNGSPSGGTFSGPGISGNVFTPSIAGPGTHSVTYTYTNTAGCTGTSTRTTTICSAPSAPTTITGTNTPCANSVNVNYSCPLVPGATSYTWTLPAGGSIVSGHSTNSIVVNFSSSFTSGLIKVSASNSCGSSSTITQTLYGIPTTPTSITGPSTEVCGGSTNKVYSAAISPGATSYTWTATSGISIVSGQGTNQITANFNSNFSTGTLSVRANNVCGSSGLRNLTIRSKPLTPGTITGATSFCANQQGVIYSIAPVSNATSYNWLVPTGAVITSGQGTTSITVNFGNKTGNIKVAAGNACGFSSYRSKKVTKIACREAFIDESKNEISIYPNPSNGAFTIQSNATMDSPVVIQIFDLMGRLIVTEKIYQSEFLISHPNLTAGTYTAIINSVNEVKSLRIVVSP